MDAQTKAQIATLAKNLLAKQVEAGTVANTPEAIRAAVPQAMADATEAVMAAEALICG
jgi:hypothetical protein